MIRRLPARGLVPVLCVLIFTFASPARSSPLRYGLGLGGQPGVLRTLTGFPAPPGAWAISAFGSYGWQPDLLTDGDAAHETWGRLALSYSPWSFLQITASLDQNVSFYDSAGEANTGLVMGGVGDPRISLRSGWDLGSGFSLAALFNLLFPASTGVFGVSGDAISPSIDLAVTFAPEGVPLGVHLQLGYHHDRTSSLTQATDMPAAEQLALSGASASLHHLALGLGVEYRIRMFSPYLELTGDLPLDGDGLKHSSLLVGLGARLWLGPQDAIQVLAGLELRALSGEPDPLPETGRVWTVPPLVNVVVGVSVRLPIRSERSPSETPGEPDDEPAETPGPETMAPGRITGRVVCGSEPCEQRPTVEIAGSGASSFAVDEDDGSFTTSGLPPGTYRVIAHLPGEPDREQTVELGPGATAAVAFEFPRVELTETGIRGRVTDFAGEPVRASIRIPSLEIEIQANEQGHFHIPVAPGLYQVIIWARGYATQTTRVEVTRQGVVVMNIDLQRQR